MQFADYEEKQETLKSSKPTVRPPNDKAIIFMSEDKQFDFGIL